MHAPPLHCAHGVSVLRQLLIPKACSVTEFGSGAMVRAPWEALDKRLKVLVSRDQPGGVPAELLPGELCLMSFDARAPKHTLRVRKG